MNPIQLTDEHKSNLLEMCQALFREYPYFSLEDTEYGLVVYAFNKKSEKFWKEEARINKEKFDWEYVYKGEADLIINWFEFCMTHLCEKILNPNPDKPARNLADKFKMFFWETNLYWSNTHLNVNPLDSRHPIDYLYEEFKMA